MSWLNHKTSFSKINRGSKIKILKLVVILLLSLNTASVSGFQESNKECMQCHILSDHEASVMLAKIFPASKILNIQPAAVPGLWEVMIENPDKKMALTYVSYSKKQVLAGLLIDVEKNIIATGTTFQNNRRIDVLQIPLANALILGDVTAANKIIVFDDPECPFCAEFQHEMKKVLKQRPDTAFYLIMYPLKNIHPHSYEKAKAIQCRKSIELLEKSFSGSVLDKPSCETEIIDRNIEIAKKFSISGTPTIIFGDGSLNEGYLTAEQVINRLPHYRE